MKILGWLACIQAVSIIFINGCCLLVESSNIHELISRNNLEQATALTISSINSTLLLYETIAPGANWQRIATGGDGKYIYGIVQDEASASTSTPSASYSVLMSSDYGATWKSTPITNIPAVYYSTNEFDTETTRYYLFVDADTGCIVVGGGFAYTIFSSTDCGATWTSNINILTAIGGSSSGKNLIAVGALGGDIYFPENVYLSVTYGYTWDNISISMPVYEFAAVASDADFSNVMVAACCSPRYCENPVFFTSYNANASQNALDTATWNVLHHSQSCSNLNLVTDSSGSYWIANLGWGLLASLDNGVSWQQLQTPKEIIFWDSIACDSTCQLIVAEGITLEYSMTFLSSDFGESWKWVANANGTISTSFNSSVAMTPSGNYFVTASSQSGLGAPGHVYLSSNPYLQIVGVVSSGQNDNSANFTVINLGVVVISPLYLSLALVVSAYGYEEINLSISLLGNGTSLIPLGEGTCTAVYPCDSDDELTVTDSNYCLINIHVNSTYVQEANGGSLSFLATLSSSMQSAVAESTCTSTESYFQLQYTLSSTMLIVANVENSPLLLFGPRFLIVLIIVGLSFSLLGGYLGNLYSSTRTLSRLGAATQFGVLGCLVSAEVMFFYIFYNYNLKPYLWLSFVLVLTRMVFIVPGVLIWVEAYDLGLEYFRTMPEVSRMMDHDFVKGHKVVTAVVSAVLLFDSEVCILLPWKDVSDRSTNDMADENALHKSDNDDDVYFGYPSLHSMNLCLMFKLLTAFVSVIFQLVCYGLEYTSAPAQEDHHSWKEKQLGVRIALWSYSIMFIISNLRSIVIFLNTRRYTKGTTVWELACKLRLYLCAFDASGRLDRAWKSLNICCRYQDGYKWWSIKSRLIILKLCIAVYVCAVTARHSHFTFWEPSASEDDGQLEEFYIAEFWVFVVAIYSFAWILDMSIAVEYDDYNPQLDMAEISVSRKLDATNITKLLSRSCVLFSMADLVVIPCLLRTILTADVINEFTKLAPKLLLIIEFISPCVVWSEHVWREERKVWKALLSLIRIDIIVVSIFLKIMLLVVLPLSLLSNLSRMNATMQLEELNTKSGTVVSVDELSAKLLSFELRDNWEAVDGESTEQSKAKAKRFKFLQRLLKRFSVVYSLSKLCGTIVLALYNNSELTACGSQGEYNTGGTCPVSYAWNEYTQNNVPVTYSSGCVSFCFGKYPTQFTYAPLAYADSPPLPPNPWQCSVEISNACVCNNWIIFECSVLVLHVIHFLIQCYFYIRYNSFDPQQNQINCVETYTFAGKNLALFLTQPLICSLSVIEAVCICIVWVKVILAPTVFCTRSNDFAFNAVRMEFALYITITEIYKANMSAFTRHWRQHHYWWAVFSLIRLDLSIFYGSTLFFQAFFFPFSLMGACCGGTSSRSKPPDKETDHLRSVSSAGIAMIATTLQQEFIGDKQAMTGDETSDGEGIQDLEVAGTVNPVASPLPSPVGAAVDDDHDIHVNEVANPISDVLEGVDVKMVEKNVANDQ